MELIRGLHNLRPAHRRCVATIGAFDGMHRGHQAVLERLKHVGAEYGLPTVLITLEPLPREFFGAADAPPRLTNFREKLQYAAACGIDRLLCIQFNAALSRTSAENFIEDVFVERLGVRCFVVGDDLRFGADQRGDFALLCRIGAERGFATIQTDCELLRGERVSSTRLRDALRDADFTLAEALLGRPYSLSGKVVYGQRLGHRLGVPTANVPLRRLRAPLAGVFVVEVGGLSERWLPAVANIGTRPTVNPDARAAPLLETHLLNFSDNVYGKVISVVFRKKLRDEQQFASLDALKQKLRGDIDAAQRYFGFDAAPAR